jgi:hypothetical protein
MPAACATVHAAQQAMHAAHALGRLERLGRNRFMIDALPGDGKRCGLLVLTERHFGMPPTRRRLSTTDMQCPCQRAQTAVFPGFADVHRPRWRHRWTRLAAAAADSVAALRHFRAPVGKPLFQRGFFVAARRQRELSPTA